MEQQNAHGGPNRAAPELHERPAPRWKERETRFEKLFSPDILKDKAFLKEKLGFYHHLQAKYARSNVPEEKITLIILARQQELLHKQVYPNIWQRLLQRIMARSKSHKRPGRKRPLPGAIWQN